MSDAIDLIGYFAFFWLFLFNRRFRESRVADWQAGGWIERFFMCTEAVISFVIGVVIPIYVIARLVQQ